MQIFRPDFDRRIDLPGAGPCPRPVDIDQRVTGFADLVSLRVYSFARGAVIDGEAEDDELLIIVMRGAIKLAVEQGGTRVGAFNLRHHQGKRVVYMPPHSGYHLTAMSDADVAYARVKPSETPLPEVRAFGPADDGIEVVGHATGMVATLRILSSTDASAPNGFAGILSERLVHVRSEDGGALDVAGGELTDWDSASLARDETARLHVTRGNVECLTISATHG